MKLEVFSWAESDKSIPICKYKWVCSLKVRRINCNQKYYRCSYYPQTCNQQIWFWERGDTRGGKKHLQQPVQP